MTARVAPGVKARAGQALQPGVGRSATRAGGAATRAGGAVTPRAPAANSKPRAPKSSPPTDTPKAAEVRAALAACADPARAKVSASFFKTGPGQYGEGDRFLGVSVPAQRKIARRFRSLPLAEIESLLESANHEERLTALLVLVDQYQRGTPAEQGERYRFYLNHTDRINNWDLVDSSAPYVVGEQLVNRDRKILRRLARSESLWERRIAMLATFAFIKRGESADALELAAGLIGDRHDLMHKALGWVLREVGKRAGEDRLRRFLGEHRRRMPRTMLRYAVERFGREERKGFLA